MIEGKPSETALMVAAMRAYHNAFAPEPKILNDHLAMDLGGFPGEAALKAQYDGTVASFTALSDRKTAELFVRRICESVCMRSRYVEGQLEAGLERGLRQLVVLGAGLDSIIYRLSPQLSNLDLFEVDYPSTQIWKKERLAALNIELPENLKFVPFDFENQTLLEALRAGGVDTAKMTLFPWLGVQPYLTDAAVRATLKAVCEFPKGSEIVMDFVSPRYENLDDLNADGLDQLSQVVEKMGEPFLSRYTPDALKKVMLECGFGSAELPRSEELVERFLGGNKGVYTMPDSVVSMAAARV